MDRHYLNITAFGQTDIIERLNKVDAIDRLVINCQDGEIDQPESYYNADYIILNRHFTKEEFVQIEYTAPVFVRYILYVDVEEFKKLPEEDVKFYADVWTHTEEILSYRLSKFLEKGRDRLDAELTVNQLDTLIDALPDLIWYKDVRGAHIKVNNAFCKTVNKTKEMIKDRGH